MILSQEQQQLVADNYKLIFAFANKKHLDVDEYSDILSLSLCKAAMTFQKKSAFSTYVYSVMDNDLRFERRKDFSQCRNIENIAYSLDEPINTTTETTYGEIITDFNTSDVLEGLIINEIWSLFNKVETTVVEGLLSQLTQQEIANKIGCSRSNVAMIIASIRTKVKKYLM